jgi:hypothetical protein
MMSTTATIALLLDEAGNTAPYFDNDQWDIIVHHLVYSINSRLVEFLYIVFITLTVMYAIWTRTVLKARRWSSAMLTVHKFTMTIW